MLKKHQKYITFFILISLLFPANSLFALNKSNDEKNLDNYLEYFYNRYSLHFDDFGLKYRSPTYGIVDFKNPKTAREWMALASYYKYRAINNDKKASRILRRSIFQVYYELSNRPAYTQSFNDSEALFLMIRIIENVPNIISKKERNKILNLINNYLEQGIKANDTENRAIIASAHWQCIVNYLYNKNKIDLDEKNYLNNLIRNKIDKAIVNTISNNGWYFENKMQSFTPHYHTVSAYMLMIYGDITNQKDYTDLAEKMYYNIKKITFNNGMVEAKLGHRPIGLGAQFYLMQALLGKYFNDDDYRVYLFYASGSRFFSDRQHLNRLEFHSTIEFSEANYHDDYAFSDAAELGLLMDKLKDISLNYRYYFDHPIKNSNDKYFKIKNLGNKIFVNNKINLLGSFGNWSHLY